MPPYAPIQDKQTTELAVSVDDTAPQNPQRIVASVDIEHTYHGDLRVALVDPQGTEVVLHNREGGGADNLQGSYDSEHHGGLREALGQNPRGTWRFRVFDGADRDEGEVKSVELKLD